MTRRQLERDARELVWRVLERFDQIPTPQQVEQATRQIVAAFAFLRVSDGALGRQDGTVPSNGTNQNPSTPPPQAP